MITSYIARLVRGESLSEAEAAELMALVMDGEATSAQVAAIMTALRMKGETAAEVTGLARTARQRATRFPLPGSYLDTAGTGGDGLATFNVSTLAAIVAAACGVKVAKHGNRAASSACGSADVLEALGVRIDLTPERSAACIEEVGIAFLFAPLYHPSFRHAAAPRRELGIRSVFNILGPLCNPAGAEYQTLGAADPGLAGLMIDVLANLGVRRAMAFCGENGMDELNTAGINRVIENLDGRRREYDLDPAELGLGRCRLIDLRGGTPVENAAIARAVLAGEPGPRRDTVLLSAAAALLVAGAALDWSEGIERAAEAVDSGRARGVLERWVEFSRRT